MHALEREFGIDGEATPGQEAVILFTLALSVVALVCCCGVATRAEEPLFSLVWRQTLLDALFGGNRRQRALYLR